MTLQIISSVISGAVFIALGLKLVHIFQLGSYRVLNFVKWSVSKKSRYTVTLMTVAFLGFGSTFIIKMLLNRLDLASFWAYFGLLFFVFLGISATFLHASAPVKVPLKYTPRVKRLFFTYSVLCFVSAFSILYFLQVQYLPILAVGLPILVLVAAFVNEPIEWCVRKSYLRKAKKKLFSPEYNNLIRIGITGSYGKTTCKNILAQILSSKYKVVSSPASFNTPMGFCRTVLHELKPDTEVLIMEMGARRRGDIKTMCKLFKPQHGLLTAIGLAHLETFKTPENIRLEKMELINAIPDGGIKIIGDETKTNIEMCSEMSRGLGVSDAQIELAIKNLQPTPHRLELITGENGVKILDDSYNSNPNGAALALRELARVSGGKGKKVVLTPGMVELGSYQFEANKIFAEHIATVADVAIIVGETNKVALSTGLKDFKEVYYVQTVEEAKKLFPKILSAGDTLLIENDLPDNF